jgi:hypothetical protein
MKGKEKKEKEKKEKEKMACVWRNLLISNSASSQAVK